MAKLVSGVGINDAGSTYRTVSGRVVACQFYGRWRNMLERCYSKQLHARRPTYAGCTVCDEWLTLSNFKAWMEKQPWQGNHLDKDLLSPDNKIYSPQTCVFVSPEVNTFTIDCTATRGAYPIGVCLDKSCGKFQAVCRNPFSKKLEKLGRFTTPEEAHQAWKRRKHELACQLADLQSDQRVANALRNRYL